MLPLRQGPGDHQPEEGQKADCWQCLDLHVATSGGRLSDSVSASEYGDLKLLEHLMKGSQNTKA